jgi:hypothetical protein
MFTLIDSFRSPLEKCGGTRPALAATWRPFLNSQPSPMAATTRRGGHRADAFDLRSALAGFTVAKNLFDLLGERGNRSCPVAES